MFKVDFSKEPKPATAKTGDRIFRYWMPPNSERQIVFLSADGVEFKEHSVKVAGKFESHTCLTMFDKPCPLCELAKKRNTGYATRKYAFSILDLTPYTDREGKEHKNVLKLFAISDKVYQKIRRIHLNQVKNQGTLKGVKVNAIRLGIGPPSSPGSGEDFEFIEALSEKELLELNPKAKVLDYETLLRPDESRVEEIARVLASTNTQPPETPQVNYE
jgi:hypothetical protein